MSATGFLDACGFIPASSGTGNFVVSAAVQGYQTPAGAGAVNGTIYSYRAESSDKTQWEEGFGTYTVSSTTLARTTITANSSGGTTAINFSAAPNVFITALSADLQNASLLNSGTVSPSLVNALSTASGSAPSYAARAFVNFSVSGGVVTVNNSGNVASVTRNSVGVYAIAFSTAMPDANYAYCLNSEANGTSGNNAFVIEINPGTRTISGFGILCFRPTTSTGDQIDTDPVNVSIVIFR